MAFIYFFHFVLSECWQTWLRVRHNGREAGRIPPQSAQPDTSIIFENPARSCQPEIFKEYSLKRYFPHSKDIWWNDGAVFPDKILLRKSASKLLQVNLAELYVFKYPYLSWKFVLFFSLIRPSFHQITLVFPFCFIGMVGGLICDECVCIECVIRQMFSFPDHSGCMSSMALMFHSQWYLSLTSQMLLHPTKWNASFSVPAIFISTFFSGRRSYKLVT